MGLFKRNKSPAQLSARQLARRLHDDEGRTDQQIADAIGASRAQITKIRNGQETGALLRPRLIALAKSKAPTVRKRTPRPKAPAPRARLAPSQKAPRPHAYPQSRASSTRIRHTSITRAAPLFDALAPDDIGEPVSFAGRAFGWIAPDGSITKQPPAAAPIPGHMPVLPMQSATPSPRRHLREQYTQLRQSGRTDAAAQATIRAIRDTEREARQRQAQRDEYDQTVAALVPALMEPARHWLMVNAGMFTPADVARKARQMAEHHLHQQQPARLPDEWVRRQLTAPS